MEKVYLALETVGLTAEKTKLENDCREGASELKTTDVSVVFMSRLDGLGLSWSVCYFLVFSLPPC